MGSLCEGVVGEGFCFVEVYLLNLEVWGYYIKIRWYIFKFRRGWGSNRDITLIFEEFGWGEYVVYEGGGK